LRDPDDSCCNPDMKVPGLDDDLFAERPVLASAFDFPDGHDIQRHAHPGGQLEYATTGVMTVETADGTWVIPSRRAVWIPPRVVHEVRTRGETKMRTIYVAPDLCDGLPGASQAMQVTPLLRELIVACTILPQPYPMTGPNVRLIAVLIDEIAKAPVAPLGLPSVHDGRLLSIAAGLKRDPTDGRALEAWGSAVGASARTLARLFRRETGLTFNQWREQLRLLEAVALLAAGVPVTEVALNLGYNGTSAFRAMFRRATGRKPSSYFSEL
jgi:AraC-like DNA-binding protein